MRQEVGNPEAKPSSAHAWLCALGQVAEPLWGPPTTWSQRTCSALKHGYLFPPQNSPEDILFPYVTFQMLLTSIHYIKQAFI